MRVGVGALAVRLRALPPGGGLTLVGAAPACLPHGTPPLLRLELAGAETAEAMLARLLDDLAELALGTWPNWPDTPPASWRRAADRFAAAGRRPRFPRGATAETELRALHPAAGAPTPLFPIDAVRPDRAAVAIAAMEWVRRQTVAALGMLSEMPPDGPPWDRVMHGALVLEPAPAPAAARLLPPAGPRGSATERRMRAAVRADPALADLFEDEVTLPLGPLGPSPRVDLAWRAGKVVVEIDGPEHERDPNYGADRHRDYELLVAGYLVLRLTNAEIELDLARSLDKVRRVVALRSARI